MVALLCRNALISSAQKSIPSAQAKRIAVKAPQTLQSIELMNCNEHAAAALHNCANRSQGQAHGT